jgi:hypothetical protein
MVRRNFNAAEPDGCVGSPHDYTRTAEEPVQISKSMRAEEYDNVALVIQGCFHASPVAIRVEAGGRPQIP